MLLRNECNFYKQNYYDTKQNLDNLLLGLKKFFNEDQLKAFSLQSTRGMQWSDETCEKSISLRYQLGITGYEKARLFAPLPGRRTISRRLEDFHLSTGTHEKVIQFLKHIYADENPNFRRNALLIDRMSLIPGQDIESKSRELIGFDTLSGDKTVMATDGLAVLFAGTIRRFKQIVCHEYTGKSVDGANLKGKVIDIMEKLWNDAGIFTDVLVHDLGPENVSMLKSFGISVSSKNIQCSVKHPLNENFKLWFCPDAIHDFKNIACNFRKQKKALIPNVFVEKFNLSSKFALMSDVEKLFRTQQHMNFQPAQKLTKDVMYPTHFEKMRVPIHTRLFSNDVISSMSFLLEKSPIDIESDISNSQCDDDYESTKNPTVWFFKSINKWLNIMKSRKKGIPLKNEEKMKEIISYLNEMILLFDNIKIGDRKLPCLVGASMATRTVIEMSMHYKSMNAEFFYPGFITQDALENVFSVIRSVRKMPSPLQFTQQIRAQIISTFTSDKVRGSSYEFNDEFENGNISFLSFIRDNHTSSIQENQEQADIFDELDLLDKEFDFGFVDLDNIDHLYNEAEINTFYYVVGFLLQKLFKKNFECHTCKNELVNQSNIATRFNRLTQLRKSLNNYDFLEPSDECFKFHLKMENVFQKIYPHFNDVSNTQFKKNFTEFILMNIEFWNEHCYLTTEAIVRVFIDFRVYIQRFKRDIHTRNAHSSKSMS